MSVSAKASGSATAEPAVIDLTGPSIKQEPPPLDKFVKLANVPNVADREGQCLDHSTNVIRRRITRSAKKTIEKLSTTPAHTSDKTTGIVFSQSKP